MYSVSFLQDPPIPLLILTLSLRSSPPSGGDEEENGGLVRPPNGRHRVHLHQTHERRYVRFRAVCTSWRSAAPKRPRLPLLVVAHPVGDGVAAIERHDVFFGLLNSPNTTDISTLPHFPGQGTIHEKLICGSSRGWLVILDNSLGISLHNPFTRFTVRLPTLTDVPSTTTATGWQVNKSDQGFEFLFPDGTRGQPGCFTSFGTFLVKKVVLSSDPERAPEECVAMAIGYGGGMLIHCRLGDTSWTPLSLPSDYSFFEDIIFYQGRFYAASGLRVYVCHTGARYARAIAIFPTNPSSYVFRAQKKHERKGIQSYLVVSSGDLLLTSTSYGVYNEEIKCDVFRVNLYAGQLRLIQLKNLGGRALFLGDKSMSISTAASAWCKGNCIYYSCLAYKTIPHSRWRAKNGYPRKIPQGASVKMCPTISIFSMKDRKTSSIPNLPDHFRGLHWLTPSL